MDTSTNLELQHITDIEISVVSEPGKTKVVTMPTEPVPVKMGMHGPVALHYKYAESQYEPHATSIDYLVGAVVACLTGTFGGSLEALGQPILDGKMSSAGVGRVVKDGGVLRVESIHIDYRIERVEGVTVEAIEKAHTRHHRYCPVARSVGDAITITTAYEIVDA